MTAEAAGQQRLVCRIARVPGLPSRWVGDRVIVSVGGDRYRELAGLAMPIWVLLDRPHRVDELVAELVEIAPDGPADLLERVEGAVADLMDRGLVREEFTLPGPAGAGRFGAEVSASSPEAPSLVARPSDDPLVAALRMLLVADLSPGALPRDLGVPTGSAGVFVERAVATRMTGVLWWLVRSGVVDLPAEADEALGSAHERAVLWCLYLERRLLEFLGEAHDRGIRPIVVKGTATAHLDRPDPSMRTFADLDLLIPGEHMDETVELLIAAGGRRPWPQRRPGFDGRFAKSVTVTMPDGVEMDLHRTLCDGVHGLRIPVEELHAAPDAFELAGTPVAVLRPEHRVLHAAYHAMLGSRTPALHSLRDLLGHLVDPTLDRDRVIWTAHRWRATAVLAAAVDAVSAEVEGGGEALAAWRRWRGAVAVDADERAIIAEQRSDGSSFGLNRLAAVDELASRGDQLAYVASVLWPTREHLDARGDRRGDLVRRLLSRLGRGGPNASQR